MSVGEPAIVKRWAIALSTVCVIHRHNAPPNQLALENVHLCWNEPSITILVEQPSAYTLGVKILGQELTSKQSLQDKPVSLCSLNEDPLYEVPAVYIQMVKTRPI